MSETVFSIITDRDGMRGITRLRSEGVQDEILVRLEDGMQVLIPYRLLIRQEDGSYFLPYSLRALYNQSQEAADGQNSAYSNATVRVIPVVAEQLQVDRRQIEAGRVRFTKKVHEREAVIEEPVLREEVDVRHVPINQVIETIPPVQQQGDSLVIPVVEEILVVEKRLILKEELHITKRKTTVVEPQVVTLHNEEVVMERMTSVPDDGQIRSTGTSESQN